MKTQLEIGPLGIYWLTQRNSRGLIIYEKGFLSTPTKKETEEFESNLKLYKPEIEQTRRFFPHHKPENVIRKIIG